MTSPLFRPPTFVAAILFSASACAGLPRAEAVGASNDDDRRGSVARAQLEATESGRRTVALIAAINAGDSAAIIRFGREHYDPNALAESGGEARLLNRWLEIRETLGPITVDTVVSSNTSATTIWARGTISRSWLTFRVATDTAPPHRLQRIGLGRGLRPPNAIARVPTLREAELLSEIDEFVERTARADLFSGVVVVRTPGGRVFNKAYGFGDRASRRPLSSETPFDVASVGKTFTAVAIGILLDRGRLRFSDSVGHYLPELPSRLRRLTIEQLLEHSSGLGELGPSLDSAMRRATSVSAMLSHLRDSTLAFTPGSNFSYSNRGYILLGAVVERASGLSYERFVAQSVFAPAGMTRTSLGAPPTDRALRYTRFPTLRSSYVPGPRTDFDPRDDLAPGPHGGAYSSAVDLERFAVALLTGSLLSTNTTQLMTAPRQDYPWSKGFMVGGSGRASNFGHAGGAPGSNSLLRVFPLKGYVVAVLSNYDSGANIVGGYISELIEASPN